MDAARCREEQKSVSPAESGMAHGMAEVAVERTQAASLALLAARVREEARRRLVGEAGTAQGVAL